MQAQRDALAGIQFANAMSCNGLRRGKRRGPDVERGLPWPPLPDDAARERSCRAPTIPLTYGVPPMSKSSIVLCLVAAAAVAACSDAASSHQITGPGPVLRSGGSVNSGGGGGGGGTDTSLVSGGG